MTNFKARHPLSVRDFIYNLISVVKGLLSLGKAVISLREWIRELELFPFEF